MYVKVSGVRYQLLMEGAAKVYAAVASSRPKASSCDRMTDCPAAMSSPAPAITVELIKNATSRTSARMMLLRVF